MLARLPSGISVNPEAVESVRMGIAPTGQQAVIIEMYGGKVEGRNFCIFPDTTTSLFDLYDCIVKAVNDANGWRDPPSRNDAPEDDNDDDDDEGPTFLGLSRITPSNN